MIQQEPTANIKLQLSFSRNCKWGSLSSFNSRVRTSATMAMWKSVVTVSALHAPLNSAVFFLDHKYSTGNSQYFFWTVRVFEWLFSSLAVTLAKNLFCSTVFWWLLSYNYATKNVGASLRQQPKLTVSLAFINLSFSFQYLFEKGTIETKFWSKPLCFELKKVNETWIRAIDDQTPKFQSNELKKETANLR